ncbi:PA2778 family cysteine peptidase [Paraglaciecola aquimarina]|uniref:PA2778 family cysteine peptidase n=1 Tax=Paraglaciecola algarum TaxID=3050085 RepID=A0ABS9D6G0_9ALTE|nr:PA2778 family cysteine peptidase [Paraglaciecola sp. G1-23]MCF2948017.1 PA2778 family cysteine peptidase [Paraglaciecola sp. G1-23]
MPQSENIRLFPPQNLAASANIQSLPFYPQEQFFCGPTTLAELFNYHGMNVTPAELAPNLFIPSREGSLQLEMISATRQYNFVPYSQAGSILQIIHLISQGIPVIVLQNNSISWLPMWHYAVVKGYDLQKSELILNTGKTEDHRMSFELFERTWQRSSYWMLVPLPSVKTSQHLESHIYIKAAYDLMRIGKVNTGLMSLKSAIKEWPEQWLSYFLLANHYLNSDVAESLKWFHAGLTFAQTEPDYLNNYAYALAMAGCDESAKHIIHQALLLAPNNANIQDTQRQINFTKSATQTAKVSCTIIQ